MGKKKQMKRKLAAPKEVDDGEVKKQRKERPPPALTTTPAAVANDTFEIVPWSSRDEWETMRRNFHDGLYEKVIEDLCVWRERVPTLPVGAEVTLLIAQALVYDKQELCSEDRAKSLYSLALIRYLNHVGHYSAHALGEKSTLSTRDLASLVGTPDWLTSLRNEVSHGTNTPSLESLRVAGLYICEWLKERYWKDSAGDEPDTSGKEGFEEEVTTLLNAFLAARIYALRGISSIKDPSISKFCSSKASTKVSTKTIGTEILQTIKTFVANHTQAVLPLVAKELLPAQEFFKEFCRLVSSSSSPAEQEKEGFDQLVNVWSPLTTLLQRKGKLLEVCECLIDIHVECQDEPFVRWVVAAWINNLLELHEEKCGAVFSNRLHTLLKKSVLSPDSSSKLFLPRLLKLVEPKMGEATVRKLEALASVWTDNRSSKKTSAKTNRSSIKPGSYFTLEQFQTSESSKADDDVLLGTPVTPVKGRGWTEDRRGSEFWKHVSIGVLLHTPE